MLGKDEGSWQIRRLIALLATISLVVVGCNTGAGPGSEVEVGVSADPSAATGRIDSLRVAVAGDFGPLNIFAQHEETLTELVYDKLLAPSPYVDDPQPWLAERVTKVDASTWEAELRSDVTWHDGEPFTAEDVKFTLDFFKRAPTGRWTHHVSDVPEIESVEVMDETTVRFNCAYPCPFLGSVTLADLPMLPEHFWATPERSQNPREVTEFPVGTGPYRLVDYSSESGYRFEAYQDYFAGRAVVDELVMPIIEEPSTAFTALRTGEVDAVDRVLPPELVEQFQADDAIAVADTAPLRHPDLFLNYEREPFDRHEFRAAVTAAVDRRALLETVWLGQGRAATEGYMHPDTPWSAPGTSTTHQPERARRLLDDLGATDSDRDGIRELGGQPLRFTIRVAGTEPVQVRAAELLTEQFADVGMDVDVQTLDAGSIGALFDSRDFDMYVSGAPTHGVADPTQFILSHRSGFLWNLPEVDYPAMAKLIDEWMATTTIEGRTDKLFEMEERYNRQPTQIPLHYPEGHYAYRPDTFDGWVESPGYGLVHKWSLLSPEVAREANAVVDTG